MTVYILIHMSDVYEDGYAVLGVYSKFASADSDLRLHRNSHPDSSPYDYDIREAYLQD